MFMDAIANVFTPTCLFLIWAGTMIGIVFGSIPGLSATMAVVLFLPMTFSLEAELGLALLTGLYMGGISGGLISAILLKIPGTPSSISTIFDGGPMADHGEAGRALGVGILASTIGSLLGIVALIFISPILAKIMPSLRRRGVFWSIRLRPHDYCIAFGQRHDKRTSRRAFRNSAFDGRYVTNGCVYALYFR